MYQCLGGVWQALAEGQVEDTIYATKKTKTCLSKLHAELAEIEPKTP